MEQITLRLDEETIKSLDDEADEHDRSRSEHIRKVIDSRTDVDELRKEHEAEVAELRDEIQSLEAKRDDLQRQLASANQRIDTTNELVEHVRETRSLETKKASAGIFTRTKWWLVGMEQESRE